MRFILFPTLLIVIFTTSCSEESGADLNGIRKCKLVISDSIGVVSDTTEYVFGDIRDLQYLDDGRMIVLDRGFRRIAVFSEEGHFITEIVGNGSGPGEFTTPHFIAPRLTGGFILSAFFEKKLVYYDSSCLFEREVSFTGRSIDFRPGCPFLVRDINDSMFVATNFFMRYNDDDEIYAGTEVSLWNGNNRVQLIRSKTAEQFDPIRYQKDTRILYDYDTSNGHFYWSEAVTDAYIINCLDIRSDSSWIFLERDWQPISKPDSVIEAEIELFRRSWVEGTGNEPEFALEPSRFYVSMHSLYVGPDGNVWVRRADSENPYFDVYGVSGELLFECSVDISLWQECEDWRMRICQNGFLVTPINPDICPKVYIMELIDD